MSISIGVMSNWTRLSKGQKKYIIVSICAVLIIYSLIAYLCISSLYKDKTCSDINYIARMNPEGIELGDTPQSPIPNDVNTTIVKVGTYIDDIDNFSIKDSTWSANFYLWFTWTGDENINPGDRFITVDGVTNKKELLDEYHGNGINYQRYHISVKMIKFFDTFRTPLEDQMLNIYIEDVRDDTSIQYVADTASNISSRVNIPGYKIINTSNVVKTHTYTTSFGDPRVLPDSKEIVSQYIYAIKISRLDYGFYFKIFLSLFAALLLALTSFFIRPCDIAPRFSLPTGAFFGAVANSYVANSILPSSGSFGLVDYIAGIGLFTIFLSIVVSLVSHYFFVRTEAKDLSAVLDIAMFWVIGLSCLILNIAIPLCARG